ncbi:hypothetical protein BDY21DRAFT_284481 [Lineolata rhizophorae]|uniref:Molybdopterin synthase sulfur carrier subunit n=1 Tax=Lineolata rhizophorae TaxID=578093 RepID=A0A6A6P2M0_9PEZI|nr:hypothetical protein BDY21DRAFT_284481 [Lineolata rhizophorae]
MADPAASGTFTLLYFASAATFTGKVSDKLEAPMKLSDLSEALERRYPGLKSNILESCAITVNLQYVDLDEDDKTGKNLVIRAGDEVAIIPPVSSGPHCFVSQTLLHIPQSLGHARFVTALIAAANLRSTAYRTVVAPTCRSTYARSHGRRRLFCPRSHRSSAGWRPSSSGRCARYRACAWCRKNKVGCERDPSNPDGACRRCAKHGRQCVTPPAARKRQRKADTRVANLERDLNEMRERVESLTRAQVPSGPTPSSYGQPNTAKPTQPLVYQQSGTGGWFSPGSSAGASDSRTPQAPSSGFAFKRDSLGSSLQTSPTTQSYASTTQTVPATKKRRAASRPRHVCGAGVGDHSDLIRRIDSIVDQSTANRIFERYVAVMCPQFPAVPIQPGTTAKQLKESKPILFLSILNGTCYGLASHEVQKKLGDLSRDVFADCVFKNVEKSLEVIQAFTVSTLWYRPPQHFERHNFWLMANMAADFAVDLGLGRDYPFGRRRRGGMGNWLRRFPDPEDIDSRRVWLVSYYMTTSISMILRRPFRLRWEDYQKYFEDCLHVLDTSEQALPSDKKICHQVRLAHLWEEIAIAFSMVKSEANITFTDQQVTRTIQEFEKKLHSLQEMSASIPYDHVMKLGENITCLYIHEIAMHSNHNIGDFKAPFTYETFEKGAGSHVLGPSHLDAVGKCISACRGILDIYSDADIDTILVMPALFAVRCIFALVCLMKFWVSVNRPGDLGNLVKAQELHLEDYFQSLDRIFQSIVDVDVMAPHAKFHFVIKHLKGIFARMKDPSRGPPEGESLPGNNSATNGANMGQQMQSQPSYRGTAQTPLHLLSEVAMGSNGNTAVSAGPADTAQWYMNQDPLANEALFDPNMGFQNFDMGFGAEYMPELWSNAPLDSRFLVGLDIGAGWPGQG